MHFTALNQIEISFPQLILKTKVRKFLKRIFCLGDFWQEGFLSRGFLSGGLCLGGFCLGGFCPRTFLSGEIAGKALPARKNFIGSINLGQTSRLNLDKFGIGNVTS